MFCVLLLDVRQLSSVPGTRVPPQQPSATNHQRHPAFDYTFVHAQNGLVRFLQCLPQDRTTHNSKGSRRVDKQEFVAGPAPSRCCNRLKLGHNLPFHDVDCSATSCGTASL